VSPPGHPSGEELNPGDVTEARQAASLILLRDSADGAEVLLVQRNPEQRFMGGAWVFPGGAVHAGEDADHAAAAVRELEEEAGIALPDDTELVAFSRWITPQEVKVRFDTWFFAAEAPAGIEPRADGSECVDCRWLTPAAALEAHAQDELALVFPTIKHLELLSETASVEATLAAARARPVEPVMPKVAVRDGSAQVLLPGEPGYEDA
jgi:8-oxo-dGTP pyrophosphatase MutT (NUDIX family)